MRGRSDFRALLWSHLATAAPFAVLGVWFGIVDHPGVGESRSSVEGYVVAAHVAAALVLAAVIVASSPAAPGGLGLRARIVLGIAGAYLLASLLWPPLFSPYAFAMFFLALFAATPLAVWWLLALVELLRARRTTLPDPAAFLRGVHRRAWLSLLVVLPGHFAWVWASRVQWFVF